MVLKLCLGLNGVLPINNRDGQVTSSAIEVLTEMARIRAMAERLVVDFQLRHLYALATILDSLKLFRVFD